MFEGLKQFVPSQVCLKCDGCCRFKQARSPWQPKIAKEETRRNSLPMAVQKMFSKQVVDEKRFIRTLPYHDMHICHFFSPQHNTCGIYAHRPFECQLYPFLLTGEGKHLVVCVHLLCPYVHKHKDSQVFHQHIGYLRDFFSRDDVRAFLKRNPVLMGDYTVYREEWEPLFRLEK